MKKITDATSYEGLEKYCLAMGYSLTEVGIKYCWFKENNLEGRYDSLLEWINIFRKKFSKSRKIEPSVAKYYRDKYGAVGAVDMIKEELDIDITRQGVYLAAKKYEEGEK